MRGEVRDRCPAGPVLDAAKSSLISQCSYLTLLRLHLQGKRGRQLKHESVSCVRHRAPQRSAGEKAQERESRRSHSSRQGSKDKQPCRLLLCSQVKDSL